MVSIHWLAQTCRAGDDNVEFFAVEKRGGRWDSGFCPVSTQLFVVTVVRCPLTVSTGNNSLIAPMVRVGKYVRGLKCTYVKQLVATFNNEFVVATAS